MSGSGAAEPPVPPLSLVDRPLQRIAVDNTAAMRAAFDQPDWTPCILTGALDQWPASRKWSFDHFANDYGDVFGHIPVRFSAAYAGKAMRLGDFVAHLDDPVDAIPGFWIDADRMPVDPPETGQDQLWSFMWDGPEANASLRSDIGPYPKELCNLFERIPDTVYRALKSLAKLKFLSIYISRKGTYTPLHSDEHATIGSLAQFVGTKQVCLIAPDDYEQVDGVAFDPQSPDFDRFPHMAGCTVYTGQLRPGEMLIIPPEWWHCVRSETPTITLSQNFVSPTNIGPFLESVIAGMAKMDEGKIAAALAKHL